MATRLQTAPWRWATLGALTGVLLGTLWFAPAHWLAWVVKGASQGQVLLQDPRGTVWSGSAQLTLTGGAGSQDAATLPGRLAWVLQPGWAGAQVQLHAECCMQQPMALNLRWHWNAVQLSVSDHQSQWPAQWLAGLGTPWNTVQPQGQLSLSTQGLTLAWAAGRLAVTGMAQLDALNMSSHLSTLRPMGSYRLQLQGAATPSLSLSTLQGSLQLSGSGQWVGGKLRLHGEASAVPEHQAALSNLLNIIGRRDGARSIIKVG